MAAEQNLVDVTSSEHFQTSLSKDLNRISLINFWADFAEPCKQMNEVVAELSKKYPSLLFLNVDAEAQEEITESFDVESVPMFILLRGHTLLEKIIGADAAKLTKAVDTYGRSPGHQPPQSKTDKAPAAPSEVALTMDIPEKEETEEELNARMRKLMNQSTVVLFMKGNPDAPRCGFSRKIVGLLRDNSVEFSSFDILQDENVRQGLKKLNDWPTFPQLIVKGELVGGLDIVQEMIDSGEFKELVSS